MLRAFSEPQTISINYVAIENVCLFTHSYHFKGLTSGYDKDRKQEHTCSTYHAILLVYHAQRVQFYSFYHLNRCRDSTKKR